MDKILKIHKLNKDKVIDITSKHNTVEELERDCLNIGKFSKDELGKMLALGYKYSFNTMFGKCGSLRTGMEYLITPNFPVRLLNKGKLTTKDINSIPSRKVKPVNYLSALAVMVYDRISNDEVVKELLTNSSKEIIPYTIRVNKSMGVDHRVVEYNQHLAEYCYILRVYQSLLQYGTFTVENCNKVVEVLKNDSDADVFSGLDLKVL